jgi:predicted dehydrogenase
MLWMLDEYEVIHGGKYPGFITGKPVGMGGSLGRTEATGYGVVYTIREALKEMGIPIAQTTAAVQGFGNVAQYAIRGLAVTHVSRTSSYGHVIRCEVVGTEGSVFVRAGDEAGAAVGRDAAARFPADYRKRFADAYVAELTAFVRACSGEGPPGPTLESDRRAVATGVAARAGAVEGRPLEVGTDWAWP